ncbi:hypothetical protein Tco_0466191 [Tanacetum coccineum]
MTRLRPSREVVYHTLLFLYKLFQAWEYSKHTQSGFTEIKHYALQFKLAFIPPESGVVGVGKLVDDPKKVALHYLSGFFPLDLFIVIPLPQIIVLLILKDHVASSGANYAKKSFASSCSGSIPRLYRFLRFN